MSTYYPGPDNDYYHILGVKPDASSQEIKRAWRKRLKDLHPDLNPQSSSRDVDSIVNAYRVLTDPDKRSIYDKNRPRESNFSFREFLLERGDDKSLSRLLFHDLLHGYENEACELYLQSLAKNLQLLDFYDREDFMDCGYILAEELLSRKYHEESLFLLVKIATMELARPYFRHFFPELVSLLQVALQGAAESLPLERVIYWNEACVQLDFSPKDASIFLKLGALWYIRGNQLSKARFYIEECARIQNSRAGLGELERALKKLAPSSRRL